jgi:hypothetical protein
MVPVPDDPYHKAAFLGALQGLGSAYKWQDDLDHTAKDVAEVWRRIADNLTECDPVIQFQQSDDCTLQVSYDGGATWADIFNALACAQGAVLDGIEQRLDDGTLAPGGQPPPGGTPSPGVCTVYHVQFPANGAWHSPLPLGDGDTVQIEDASGGWTDGNSFQGIWYCPDGVKYILGVCDAAIHHTEGGDPVPSINHMRLIAGWGATPDFHDAFNQTITIPNGTGDVDFWLQANDGVLGDNAGSITAKVTICKGAGWSHVFDFTSGDAHGWVVRSDLTPGATCGAGGWTMDFYAPGTNDRLYITMPHAGLAHSLISRVGWLNSADSPNHSENRWFGAAADHDFALNQSGEEAIPECVQYADQNATFECSTIAQTGLGVKLQSLTLIGPVGVDPFAGL